MKRILTLFSVVLFLTSSCEKDVLDKMPLDLITDATVWQSQELIDAYVTQLYAQTEVFTSESWGNTPNQAGVTWFQPYTITYVSDEAQNNWGGQDERFKLGRLSVTGGLLEWWDRAYVAINAMNIFIDKINTASVSEEYIRKKEAEVRFLRAFNYFAMVKRYGGVPLITQPQDVNAPEEVLFPKRNKEKEVYDFIISETEAIEPDLDEANTAANYGRPIKTAALALKARAALYAGSIAQWGTVDLDGLVGIEQQEASYYYQICYDACNEIINSGTHTLYDKHQDKVTNFRQLFLEKMNPEVILPRRFDYTDGNRDGNGWSYDFAQCPLPNAWGHGNSTGPYLEMAESFGYIDGSPGALDRATVGQGVTDVAELWKNKDPRFFASMYTQGTMWKGQSIDWHVGLMRPNGVIVRNGSWNGVLANGNQRPDATGFGILKYLDESKDNLGQIGTSGTDYLVFRYGEVFLNLAEAALELGFTNEALEALNAIRKRAGVQDRAEITRQFIRNERKVELAFEGHRYWDLRRWRQAKNALSRNFSGIRYILDFGTRNHRIRVVPNIHGTVQVPVFREQNYYLPITRFRTNQNTNLLENPGYERD